MKKKKKTKETRRSKGFSGRRTPEFVPGGTALRAGGARGGLPFPTCQTSFWGPSRVFQGMFIKRTSRGCLLLKQLPLRLCSNTSNIITKQLIEK